MAGRSWKFHAGRHLLAGIAVLVFGWATGHLVVMCIAFLLVWAGWHTANLLRLYRWLQKPDTEVPESIGIWSDIYDRIASLEQENRKRKARYRAVIDSAPGSLIIAYRRAASSSSSFPPSFSPQP